MGVGTAVGHNGPCCTSRSRGAAYSLCAPSLPRLPRRPQATCWRAHEPRPPVPPPHLFQVRGHLVRPPGQHFAGAWPHVGGSRASRRVHRSVAALAKQLVQGDIKCRDPLLLSTECGGAGSGDQEVA
eukprot:scaffold76379_cov28-Tisochrysis_lutea.AAC.4